MADVWPMIHAERAATADLLAGLDEAQLSSPSLCQGWPVRQTAGHMIATGEMTPGAFFAGLVRSGFKFDRFIGQLARDKSAGTALELADRLRATASTTNHPPGPVTAFLGEALVHAEDIRRPLRLARRYPVETMTTVADFYVGSNMLIGAKRRVAGLRLSATDCPWRHGSGPEVDGTMMSLLLAMTGRSVAVADLSGPGAVVLADRQ